eukprot:1189546-Prorocentrum_minimum.AAC.3
MIKSPKNDLKAKSHKKKRRKGGDSPHFKTVYIHHLTMAAHLARSAARYLKLSPATTGLSIRPNMVQTRGMAGKHPSIIRIRKHRSTFSFFIFRDKDYYYVTIIRWVVFSL